MRFTASLPGERTASCVFSQRSDGDFSINSDPHGLATARQRLLSGPWAALHQVHGAAARHIDGVDGLDGVIAGEGDALVTATPGVVLAVQTADCVPVLFASTAGEPVIGAAHAGWRGLYEGVIEATAVEMRRLGATEIRAWIGPCISDEHYEFSQRDLTTVALRFGPDVVAATAEGRPALDVVAAARVALRDAGVDAVDTSMAWCTATSVDDDAAPRFASHRARGDLERQASAVRIDL